MLNLREFRGAATKENNKNIMKQYYKRDKQLGINVQIGN